MAEVATIPAASAARHHEGEPMTGGSVVWAGALPPDEVLAALDTSRDGLGDDEAAHRRAAAGLNTLRTHRASATGVLVRQLRSPLLLLLAVTASVAYFFGEATEAVIIGVILVASVGLGFVNEYRAERAAAALHSQITHRATVRRNGAFTSRDVTELVPGDVIELRMGELVPADVRLLSVSNLACDESILTGESLPAPKRVEAVAEHTGLADLASCGLMGTVVSEGTGTAVVVATGAHAEFGRIALALGERHAETEFQRGLRHFSGFLVRVALVLMVAIVIINVALGRPPIDALLFSLAIAVGITPQLLPAVVTTSLATGTRQLARRKVLVKRLICIEDLGNVDVLFTDKTGTLTEGHVTFDRAVDIDARRNDALIGLGLLCSEAEIVDGDAVAGNALDIALWHAAGRSHPLDAQRVAAVPFDHQRRCMSVLVEDRRGERTLITKGAPEAVLARCREAPRSAPPTLARLFGEGRRVVAVATRAGADLDGLTPDDEHDLHLEGFLCFWDRPKESTRAAIDRLAGLDVTVRVVTGDNPDVAAKVCRDLGIEVAGTMTGADIDRLDDAALEDALARTTIFARVSPDQKARIVLAQRRLGSDVAFLGDGVNDALALHKADVGISVDSATDVAKDAADVVLLEKDLHVVADGVMQGRRIFANTIKYVLMGTSSNFGNMVSAAGASAFLEFLPMLPSQILLNNLLYDTSQMAIPTDRVDPEALARPAHWDLAFIRRFMAFFGPISSLFDFATFGLMLWVFHAGESLFQSGWFIESLATQTLVIFVIRTRRVPFFRSRPSRTLVLAALGVVAVGAAIPMSPLADLLGFEPLPATFFAALVVLVVAYLALAECGKAWFFREQSAARVELERGRRAWRIRRHELPRVRHRRVHRRAARWTHHEPVRTPH
jgi:Mg2+-importing ATPase